MHFGIDLGTSNSAIAGMTDGRIRLFKTPEGTDVMPSVIHRDRRGNQTVGVRAADQAMLAPDNTVEGFKRLMGTDTRLKFAGNGDVITPEQAAAEILRSLVGQALVESGASKVTGSVVTIPAAFNQVQTEATLAAARASRLERIAILQEPVAAALAAMAGASYRSGLFLVYDLGGGTFDAALVHAVDGEITVLGHEGVNQLGGRDLDLRLAETLVFPWLTRTFQLPAGFAAMPRYLRLVRMARRATELSKVALSTRDAATVAISEDDVRLEDSNGEPIYLNVPVSRRQLEELGTDMVTRSIQCCRQLLETVGYGPSDVGRLVLIGGPTKMPFLQRRVQDELGIAVEDVTRVDPMIPVAAGAAIYWESRAWSSGASTAKAGHRKEHAGAKIEVSYDYEARTSSDHARIEIRQVSGAAGAELLLDNALGWSSNRRKLTEPVVVALPLSDDGPNRFRATVFGADGLPVRDACREIVIERLLAAVAGVPATQTIAAKIRQEDGRADTLDVLVPKGTMLPATGVVTYRLAEPLKAGGPGKVRVEVYQVSDGRVMDPHLNLLVGEFRIAAEDLPSSAALRTGDVIRIHWAMTDGQVIKVEVELPSVQQRFDSGKFWNWQLGRQDFSGAEGAQLAADNLEQAERELTNAEEAVSPASAAALPRIRDRLDEQVADLRSATDPDSRRKCIEEIRLVRQQIAIVCQQPEARRFLLDRHLQAQRGFYDRHIRAGATPEQTARVDRLLHSATAALTQPGAADLNLASDLIQQVTYRYWADGFAQNQFCVDQFRIERERSYFASDRAEFSRLVAEGDRALANEDMPALRAAYFEILRGKIHVGSDMVGSERASLMRA